MIFLAWVLSWAPWWHSAMLCCAYNKYVETKQYQNLKRFSLEIAFKIFKDYWVDEFIVESLRAEWFRIIFTPWKYKLHQDVIEWGNILNEKECEDSLLRS